MTTVNTVKIGIMPGRIETHTLEVHATFRQAIAQAGLSADGYEVKLDGATVTDLDTVVPLQSNTILLSKRVKGNADMNTVKIGVMPGRIETYGLEGTSTYAQAIELAGLSVDGFEVKVDGTPVTDLNAVVPSSANTILLSKRVKGNADMLTVKIGVMPGRIESYAFEGATTYAQALETAGLSADGFEIKADGTVVSDLNSTIASGTNTILLSKRVKGNAVTVKVGVMPGRIDSYALEDGATFNTALESAGLSADGFEVKVDGAVVTDLNTTIPSTANTILLSKRVKGNAVTVKVGVMPGRIETYALQDGATFNQALEQAGLSADGYEVKVDGAVVPNLDASIPSTANTILLSKRVKGNEK